MYYSVPLGSPVGYVWVRRTGKADPYSFLGVGKKDPTGEDAKRIIEDTYVRNNGGRALPVYVFDEEAFDVGSS